MVRPYDPLIAQHVAKANYYLFSYYDTKVQKNRDFYVHLHQLNLNRE